ncbi:hypothetical protein HK103_001797 [Boothiomyces macroporosus]|uniref:UDP-N-acetylglucosamine 2-epimerase (non-hydrolyzing) n=1 Tax=Boothiomyces macroporosus TaxID=261099 RepID=A0AAD5UDT5_9FUNG|nr:hypothetical protein HK103_001797 [Boothiomyces macroporosus]
MKVMTIIGTRPETIKMFPIIKELEKRHNVVSIVLASGQHQQMVAPLLETFSIKEDINLNVMVANQKLTDLSARLIIGISQAIAETKPDWVLVQGDTTTAFVASLIAFYHKIPVGHVEAGLRTYNRYNPFPEEINRRVIGSLGSIHFAPTPESSQHLIMEGIPFPQVHITGNTVIDALLWMSNQPPTKKAQRLEAKIYENHSKSSKPKIVLVTAHRRENWGEPLENICGAIKKLASTHSEVVFVFPMHLNPKVQSVAKGHLSGMANVILWDPLDYDVFAYLMKSVYLVMTDSGGIQEEATAFSVPILVLRETTERPEGVNAGMAKLIGTKEENVVYEGNRMLTDKEYYNKYVKVNSPYGDGKAAMKIVDMVTSKEVLEHAESGSMITEVQKHASEIPMPPSPPLNPKKRTLKELMEMKSNFPENGDGKGDNGIIAIISTYKRPKTIIRIVEACLNQSVPPKEVWITVFSSPYEGEYRKIIDEYKSKNLTDVPIHLITGGPQFTYFARFQVALLAPTKYVALLDDDVIPEGIHAFRNMLHTFNLQSNEYYGMYGCKGHVINTEQLEKEQSEYYYNYFTHEPNTIEMADVVGGLWFMKREWVKYMFIEDPITIATAEDFQITAMLLKYANIPTFIFPVDKEDKTSYLHSADFEDISEGEKTTGNGGKMYNGKEWDPHHLRNTVAWFLLNRGMTRPWAHQMYDRHDNVLMFVKDTVQANALAKSYDQLRAKKETAKHEGKIIRPWVAFAGLKTHTDEQNIEHLNEIQKIFNTNIDWNSNFLGYWTLELGRLDFGMDKGKDLMARTMQAFHHSIVNTQPIAVVLTTEGIDESTVGAGLTAADYGSPVIVLDTKSNTEYSRHESKWRKVLYGVADVVLDDETELMVYLDSIRSAMHRKTIG